MNNQRKNIAIIGASYLQLPLIEKAKEMGYITHVFAWEANDVGEYVADYFYPISIVNKDEILYKCQDINICAICSIASDLAVITVNYVANKLGIAGNSMRTTQISTNKHMMRQAFETNGDPSPKSILVDEFTDLDSLMINYPIIVKPTDRSGSRGIFKLDNSSGLKNAVQSSISESFEKKALVEEFVDGEEYSVEYISFNGVHQFLAITKKYTTGEPNFIETGHMEPAFLSEEMQDNVKQVVLHALDTLGIENSASHSELKISEDGTIQVIEIAGRMGGDCIGSELVRYSTGYDFTKMVIQVACGEKPDFTKVCEPIAVESVFIFNQDDIDELERLRHDEPEKLLKIVEYNPENIGSVTNSSNRAGCYIKKH